MYRDQGYDCKDLQIKKQHTNKVRLFFEKKEKELIPFYDQQSCTLK